MRYEIRTRLKRHKMLENTISYECKKDAYRAFGWLERQLEDGEVIAIYRIVRGSYVFVAADTYGEGLLFLNSDPFNL